MPFADELIGPSTARDLLRAMQAAAPDTDFKALRSATRSLGPLPLRERSDLLRDALLTDLPGTYADFAATIRSAARDEKTFTGWLIWPVTSAVAQRAVTEAKTKAKTKSFDDALDLLAELTGRLTSEFALRPLLRHDPQRALKRITRWTRSSDQDVRRLASEGTRPFLPWAIRVPALFEDPRATLPILDALYRDESEYVRRSVANHLNDLSRNHPDLVVETAGAWLAAPDDNTQRLVRHALRTLIKKGDPGALALMGFAPTPSVDVKGPTLTTTSIPYGGTLHFTASLTNTSTEPVQLAIDYVVHHLRANGQHSTKTFKLATRLLDPAETLEITRTHSFREITTRRYYPGEHAIELQVNGARHGHTVFDLKAP
ncbi:DNA alkylation repair protein [Streptomyces sp. NBC_01465]|uniref:DNA alkylation repair protein n=1 Tax=Streptomyces sp. NBC_01465 TaxID=2903878 RepID=UPI002E31D75E|nr:DNA alkylation repair protein [Streptomyces sp. NBC_01465]